MTPEDGTAVEPERSYPFPLKGQPTHTLAFADGHLDVHSPHPQCPKCGALMDGLSYTPRVRWTAPDCQKSRCYDQLEDTEEHLHRWCSTCRYGTWERCLDDPARTEPGDA